MLDSIILSITGGALTIIGSIVLQRINKYIKEREKRELKKEALLELHYLKLDAVVYTLGTVGEHRQEFEKVYNQRLEKQLKERDDLQKIIESNS